MNFRLALPVALFMTLISCGELDALLKENDEPLQRKTQDKQTSCLQGDTVVGFDGSSTFQLPKDGMQFIEAEDNLGTEGFEPFRALACGHTNTTARLNIFETAADPVSSGWDEEHEVAVVEVIPSSALSPAVTAFSLAMEHVHTIFELTDNNKTLFNDDDSAAVTSVLRLYDSEGALVDCLIWGHDADAVFTGNVPANNTDGHTAIEEITAENCRFP